MKKNKTIFIIFLILTVSIIFGENKINIRLTGTIISNNDSYCLLKDNDSGNFNLLKTGKLLKNSLKIVKIRRDYIVLYDFRQKDNYNIYMGSDFNIEINKKQYEQRNNNQYTEKTGKTEKRFFVKEKTFKKYLENPTEILYSASAIPAYNGKSMIGYKIKNIKKGSMIERFGIRNGDIIIQVNGIPTTDMSSLFSFYNNINSIKQFAILVKRNGSFVTLYYNIGN